MALLTNPSGSPTREGEFSNRFATRDDYELFEEDGAYVLSIELPGYDPEQITVTWDEGILNVAADAEEDRPARQGTYHRRFRFPREVNDEGITAEYSSGVLEVRLPVDPRAAISGTPIDIESGG